jgi:hypothetical protein
VLGELVPDPGIAVALVACGLARPALAARGPDLLHQALERRRLVRLPRGDAGGKGNSRAVRDQVQLRSPSAARATQCVVFRLAGARSFDAPAAERRGSVRQNLALSTEAGIGADLVKPRLRNVLRRVTGFRVSPATIDDARPSGKFKSFDDSSRKRQMVSDRDDAPVFAVHDRVATADIVCGDYWSTHGERFLHGSRTAFAVVRRQCKHTALTHQRPDVVCMSDILDSRTRAICQETFA